MSNIKEANKQLTRNMFTVITEELYVNKSWLLYRGVKTYVEDLLSGKRPYDRVKTKIVNKVKYTRPYYICDILYTDSGEIAGALLVNGIQISVYVKPKYRRMGLASKAIDSFIQRYGATGKVYMIRDTVPANKLWSKRKDFINLVVIKE